MDRVVYRKLTKKSRLGYGKYADYTVQDMFCLDWKGREYLIWSYFNLSNITFMDDILDELEIPEEMRISKPGKNEDLWEKLREARARRGFEEKYGVMEEKQRVIALSDRKRRQQNARMMVCIKKEVADNKKFSKGKMAWKNQGHRENE